MDTVESHNGWYSALCKICITTMTDISLGYWFVHIESTFPADKNN